MQKSNFFYVHAVQKKKYNKKFQEGQQKFKALAFLITNQVEGIFPNIVSNKMC